MNNSLKKFNHNESFKLRSGAILQGFDLAYETWGTLNSSKSNALLICHALTGTSHAADSAENPQSGWWNEMVGPGKAIDTNKYFVVCSNNIGACAGSTGPMSINPNTDRAYQADFPEVCVEDWVHSQFLLKNYLGIDKWCTVIGGSLGGMQALQWVYSYPDHLYGCGVIAAAVNLSTQNRAFNYVSIQALEKAKNSVEGLKLARMLGHITYLPSDMNQKFNRDGNLQDGKTVETYLDYQAEKFVEGGFSIHSYTRLVDALNNFSLCEGDGLKIAKALENFSGEFLVCSFSSDWRFSPQRSLEIVKVLMLAKLPVSYLMIDSEKGHDAFLFSDANYDTFISQFLDNSLQKMS